MNSKSNISLLNFFIFNSKYCTVEGEEHKKILYYYPEGADLDTRIRNVGLCEAIIKFTDTFSPRSCEALHTQKTRQIFLQPETDFWLVLTLNVPSHQKNRDGQVYVEYNGDEIQDHVYQSVLLTSYRLFTLNKGTFCSILEHSNNDVEVLKQSLDQFFTVHLSAVKMNEADLLDVFQGIRFLPLERYAFLRILCFMNRIEEKFRDIKYLVFLYNDQLVWSGLDQEDMQILYQHLSVSLIPSYIDSELKGGVHSPGKGSPFGSGIHFGRFMTGPKAPDDHAGLEKVPKIYLNEGRLGCHLIIYRALNATLCMLLDEKHALKMNLFKELDAEVGPHLTALASEIGEQYSKASLQSTLDMSLKYLYVYFNHMNLAQKTTIHSDMRKAGHALLPQDIMKLLADVNNDLAKVADSGEIIGKTVSDCWIIGKLSDHREFYLVLQQKNANIVDVNEEIKKLSVTHFQNIFILD